MRAPECLFSGTCFPTKIDTHRIRLVHDCIDKLIVLRTNKRFMKRTRREGYFISIIFHVVLSDEHVSSNEE